MGAGLDTTDRVWPSARLAGYAKRRFDERGHRHSMTTSSIPTPGTASAGPG